MFDPSKFTVEKARPIPVILLLDGSSSMSGEKIETLNSAVNTMIESFKDETTREVEIQVAIITFGPNGVNLALPLTPAKKISSMDLEAYGNTPMGGALSMAKAMIEDKKIIPSKGYRPTVVLISDGMPNDSWERPMNDFISSGRSSKCDRMAMAIGTSKDDPVLNKFLAGTENQVFLASDAADIHKFFQMVTMSVSVRSRSANPNQLVPLNAGNLPATMDDHIDF
ncbi:MAG: VWA domain-containing protein [Treponemataceae bacterium]